MPKKISRKEAEGEIEKAVREFDWIGEFLGSEKKRFLANYRALHVQLRGGDELRIKISKEFIHTYPADYDAFVYYPLFSIVLIRHSGKEKVVTTKRQLYQDKVT